MPGQVYTTTSHFFWLLGWNNKRVYSALLFKPKYTLCHIDRNSISIDCEPNPINLPISRILKCSLDTFDQGGTAASTCNVKITLMREDIYDKSELEELFILVANPLRKLGYKDSYDMVEVLNTYMKGEVPSIHTNPYFRELTRVGKAGDFSPERWNQTIPPDSLIPSPNMVWLLVRLIGAIIIATILVMLIIGLIYNLFS